MIVRQGLDRGMATLLRRASELRVIDAAALTEGVEVLARITEYIGKVNVATEPVISATHAAWKAALAQRATFLGPAETERKRLRGEIEDYKTEQDRLRQEAEEASRQERERLEEAERARVAAETARLEAAAKAANLKAAAAAEKRGDRAFAKRLREAPVNVAPVPLRPVFVPPVAIAPVEADGVGFRKDWNARVVSLEQLVRGVADGKVSLACVEAAQPVLDRMAKALKHHLNVPGVEAVESTIVVERRRG